MKTIIKSMLFMTLVITSFTSCTNSDKSYQTTTQAITTYTLTPTKTVAEINTLANSSTPVLYTDDDIIEAYVTSNDAGGNFYKSISFQTIPTDSSAPIGFSMSIDKSMLFENGFTPGRKVYIKLKGLYYAKVFGSMQLGVYDASQTTLMSGISKFDLNTYLFPSDTVVAEDSSPSFPRHMSLAAASVDSNLNTLIEIDNTEFADNSLARTYFDIDSGGYATNQDIVDVNGGTTHYCRISQYAPFSVGNVPSGRGSIRGVMTKYNTDYQFMVRQVSDFKLINDRTYNFNASLNETFTGFNTNQVAFANYLDFSPVGTKKWLIKSGALEMSAFGGAIESNKAYFVVPVNMDAASTLTFKINTNFYNGSALKVYRSADYTPGMKISNATLYDITSFFSLPTSSTQTSSSNPVFVNAGTYNIPTTVTGNGYFIFEYTGTNFTTGPALTTTVDIDNIVIN